MEVEEEFDFDMGEEEASLLGTPCEGKEDSEVLVVSLQ